MAEKWSTAKELRAMPEGEMRGQLDKLRSELWQARQKTAEGAQAQTHRFSVMRRQIARIQTLITQQRHESDAKAKS